jgi:drug/metabolite transporter (DMT)-like permease
MALGFNLVFFFSALQVTSVAHATLVANLAPFVVMLFAWRLFGERVQRSDLLYGTIAAGGMMLVLLAGQGNADTSWSGAGLAALALLAWSAYLIFSKRARLRLDTVSYLAAASIIGAAVTLPFAAFRRGFGTFAPRELLLVVLLALVPNSGHLLINWAHSCTPIIVISLLMLAVPIISILGAWIAFEQSLGGAEILGAVISLSALALLVLEQNRAGGRMLRSHA